MELLLKRDVFTPVSTTSELFVNGGFECFILEDPDRKIESGGTKVKGNSCVPRGRYEVVITMSNRFKKMMPLLLNVPQFSGIRIHSGNKAADTEGCLLPGTKRSKDFVSNSVIARDALVAKIEAELKSGKRVWITIV